MTTTTQLTLSHLPLCFLHPKNYKKSFINKTLQHTMHFNSFLLYSSPFQSISFKEIAGLWNDQIDFTTISGTKNPITLLVYSKDYFPYLWNVDNNNVFHRAILVLNKILKAAFCFGLVFNTGIFYSYYFNYIYYYTTVINLGIFKLLIYVIVMYRLFIF